MLKITKAQLEDLMEQDLQEVECIAEVEIENEQTEESTIIEVKFGFGNGTGVWGDNPGDRWESLYDMLNDTIEIKIIKVV